jgi:hypothetical protein
MAISPERPPRSGAHPDHATPTEQNAFAQICSVLFPPSGKYAAGLGPKDLYTMRLVSRATARCLAPHLFRTVHLSDAPGKGTVRLAALVRVCARQIALVTSAVIVCGCARSSDDFAPAGAVQLVVGLLRALCRLPRLATVRLQAVPGRAGVLCAALRDALKLRKHLPFDLSVVADDPLFRAGEVLLLCTTKAVALGVIAPQYRALDLPAGARVAASLLTDVYLERVVLTKENHAALWGIPLLRHLHLHNALVLRTAGASPFDDFTWALFLETAEQSLPSLHRLQLTLCGYAVTCPPAEDTFLRVHHHHMDFQTTMRDKEAYDHLLQFLHVRDLYARSPPTPPSPRVKAKKDVQVQQLDWSTL